jgi:cytochrome b561
MNDRYTASASALHWLIALAIICAFPLGLYMSDLPLSPWKLRLYSYHKWIGISVLTLAAIRILWRISHRPPPPLAGTPRWQQLAAEAVHVGLYLLIVAVPLSGWLMSSALGFPVVLFGVIPLPDLIGKDKALGDVLKEVHEALNYTLLALFIAHVAAALKHHFIDRDETMRRMSPFPRRKEKP